MNEAIRQLRRERLGLEEWANVTTLHPIGIAAVLILGTLLLCLPRRNAVIPLVAMACFIAPAQRVVIIGFDFDLIRLMILFGWARVLVRGEATRVVWRPVDLVFMLWLISGVIIYTTLHGSTEAFVHRLGWLYDAAGMYFLFRCLLRSREDVDRAIQVFAWMSIPVAIAFVVEASTGRNVFATLGGVPEISRVREGRPRCQGAFAHPILAGCFWASMLPIMATQLWRGGAVRALAAIGVVASMAIVVMTASSTPLIAVFVGAIGAALFPFRRWMPLLRWGALALVVLLHLLMKAPVWHLLSRVQFIGGSAGWHRYRLIDEAIKNFDEWALIGTKSTEHWGRGLYDVTNQYVLIGIKGGLLTLALFLVIIVLAFRSIGRILSQRHDDRVQTILAWALGISLSIHCINYIAISYFGQIIMIWYMLLAMIASLAPESKRLTVGVGARAAARPSRLLELRTAWRYEGSSK